MVHDLTANRDFQKTRGWGVLTIPMREEDNLTPPYEEIVLTGTTSDRDHKRYVLDYESDEKNMCDCCGSPIKIRPWDFEDNKSLCPDCEKWLEEKKWFKEEDRISAEILDDTFAIRIVKPWDINNFERENAVDNVLLWD